MDEKYILLDVLETLKNDLKIYQDMILKTSNTNLRQIFQQIRNEKEAFEYDLFKTISLKGYITSPVSCLKQDIYDVRKDIEE